MDNGWFNALMFTYGLSAYKQKKEEEKKKAFIEEQTSNLCSAVEELHTEIEHLVTVCGPVGLSSDFIEDAKLISFYAMGEVLSAQGMVAPDQKLYLKIWIANLNPMFNYTQFTQASIERTGVYEQMQSIVGLTPRRCGSCWFVLFELIYRTRLVDALQKITDALIKIVWHFSFLANGAAPFAEPISTRIVSSLNDWANAYQQTPYIHALMLLQNMLRDRKDLPIEKQLLLRNDDIQRDGQTFFVFDVLEKGFDASFGASYGKYAVKSLRSAGDKLDYAHDNDLIYYRQEGSEEFKIFYDELSE